MNKTLTIRIEDELRDELRLISANEHKPVSDLVRESLTNFVAIKKFRRIRAKALPLSEARGFLTDDDIFEIVS